MHICMSMYYTYASDSLAVLLSLSLSLLLSLSLYLRLSLSLYLSLSLSLSVSLCLSATKNPEGPHETTQQSSHARVST